MRSGSHAGPPGTSKRSTPIASSATSAAINSSPSLLTTAANAPDVCVGSGASVDVPGSIGSSFERKLVGIHQSRRSGMRETSTKGRTAAGAAPEGGALDALVLPEVTVMEDPGATI